MPTLEREIAATGFPAPDARAMAHVSVSEVCRSALFAILTLLVMALWIAGRFRHGNSAAPFLAIAGLMTVELGMAATPFILHYDYPHRYESNAVLGLLAKEPWLGRVTARIFPDQRATLSGPGPSLWSLLQNQWMEQQFPFFRIQELDIWQMPRMPERDAELLAALRPGSPSEAHRIGRLWQLTNVRYVLGDRRILADLNSAIDPAAQSFRPVLTFELTLRGSPPSSGSISPDDLAIVENPNGALTVFEYGNALPRVRFYSDWEVVPDTRDVLAKLRDPGFDPRKRVLLDQPPEPGGDAPPMKDAPLPPENAARLVEWAPRRISVHTVSAVPGVLLLNERWDPDWRATVDGRTAPILRANHLMRAVSVPAGDHRVEFIFRPPRGSLWMSLACLAGVAGAAMAPGTFPGVIPSEFPRLGIVGRGAIRAQPTSWTASSGPSAT